MCRVEPQLDCRYCARCEHHALDLRRLEGTLHKAPAQRVFRLAEQPPALDPDDALRRERDLDVDRRAYLIGDRLVIHRLDPVLGAGHTSLMRSHALSVLCGEGAGYLLACQP